MKKKIFVIVCLILTLSLVFAACGKKQEEKEIAAVIAVPDGAPALSVAEIMVNGFDFDGVKTEIDLVMSSAGAQAPAVVGTKLTGGSADIAILPTNIAVALYKKNADIKLLSTNIWGNLFMLSKGEAITDLNTLIGETVYNVSEGGTPDILMKHFLDSANIPYATPDDNDTEGKVILDYKPATTLIPMLKQNTIKYAILGEPAISKAIGVVGDGLKVVLDFQSKWSEINGGSGSYPQASLVAKASFIEGNKTYIDALIEKLSTASVYLAENENINAAKEAFKASAEATSLAAITSETVLRSGLSYKSAVDARQSIETYLEVLNVALPDDGFYYNKNA